MRLARRALLAALSTLILVSAVSAQTLRPGNDPRNSVNPDNELAALCSSYGSTTAKRSMGTQLTRSEVEHCLIAPTITGGSTFEPTIRSTAFGGMKQQLAVHALNTAAAKLGGER